MPWVVGFITLGLLLFSSKNVALNLRNNNPGNLRPNPNFTWNGQIGENKGFVVFTDILYGIRASFINLRTYFNNGYNTVNKIVSRWAPSSDNNDTQAYINFVSRQTGYAPNETLYFSDDTASKLLSAIFQFEGGTKIPLSQINAGIALA